MAKNDLKARALAKMSGFRKEIVPVPEWGGAKVILREPSAEGWLRWKDITSKAEDKDKTMSSAEESLRNLRADVTLFIDVILDEDLNPAFTPEDATEIEKVYGPVHRRLLNRALELVAEDKDTKKK